MNLSPRVILYVLTAINFLNFLDRGLIPGATNEFNAFISKNGIHENQDVYLGLLQSAFIIGYAVASIIFGHLDHFYSPFYLCVSGLVVWVVAVACCGLAFYTNSYSFLLVARMFSGVGEASFQCTIPPWIVKYSPAEETATWLSLFFTAIPVGTAAGYAYSAGIANTWGWQWSFFIEGFLMVPFVLFLMALAPSYPRDSEDQPTSIDGMDDVHAAAPSLWEELMVLLSRPIFILITLGYAAQAGALIGVSTFGSAFLMGLGFFDTETTASTTFGALVCVAGAVGTPVGGLILDRLTKSKRENSVDVGARVWGETGGGTDNNDIISLKASLFLVTLTNLAGVVLLDSVFFVYNKAAYLILVCLGCGAIFLSLSAISVAVMMAVPPAHRAFAIAIATLGLHALGDVPSPILAGLLKDRLAPGCAGGDSGGEGGNVGDEVAVSAACRADGEGLRWTLLLVSSWLGFTVLFFGLAWLRVRRIDLWASAGVRLLSTEDDRLIPPEDEEDEEAPVAARDRATKHAAAAVLHKQQPQPSYRPPTTAAGAAAPTEGSGSGSGTGTGTGAGTVGERFTGRGGWGVIVTSAAPTVRGKEEEGVEGVAYSRVGTDDQHE